VDCCKALLAQVLEGEGPGALLADINRQVLCPPGIVGRIIGRGGETIRSLQSGSGAHIQVDQVGTRPPLCDEELGTARPPPRGDLNSLLLPLQNFPPDHPRVVSITGKADCVDRAVRMVTDLINGEPGSAQQVIQKVLGSVSGCCKPLHGM
jgi:far upstream element-binding protein